MMPIGANLSMIGHCSLEIERAGADHDYIFMKLVIVGMKRWGPFSEVKQVKGMVGKICRAWLCSCTSVYF